MKKNIYIMILCTSLSLISCHNRIDKTTQFLSEEELYNKGNDLLNSGKYLEAAENFSKISQEYPYSAFTPRAQKLEAYSYYLKKDYDMTINVAEEFIKLHPVNEYTSYMYYLRALSYYEQVQDIEHDQKMTERAKESAQDLISHFADSKYAREFKLKLELLDDHLAGKEMSIGRFYLHKGEIISALKRFNKVFENYQTTSYIEEALFRLVEINLKLGVVDEAIKYASILAYNYPNSKWYKYSYDLLNVK